MTTSSTRGKERAITSDQPQRRAVMGKLVEIGNINTESALVRIAQTIKHLRHVRREEFGLALDEPAWDMLVELYCTENIGASTTAATLEGAASVPPSTARRWIKQLEGSGLVTVRPHPTDLNIQFVEMTQGAKAALERYLMRVLAAADQQIKP